MGRPNQYYTVVEPKLEDIKALRKQGLSLEKIAQKLDLKLGHLTYYRKRVLLQSFKSTIK